MDQPVDQPHSWQNVHPDFDGHRKPVSEMSDAERLQMAWEGTLLLHWARRARIQPAQVDQEKQE